jgi:pyridoxal phosphate enzyme (YggS family)
MRAALRCGQTRFGESYAQEAQRKMRELGAEPIEWHFIGPLQSNKTRSVAARFDWIHSVDSVRLGRRLSDHRPLDLQALNVCLQINVSGETTKRGVTLEDLPNLALAVAELPRLRLRGLMAIPGPETDFSWQRIAFRMVGGAFTRLQAEGFALDTLSLGMSADLEAAIAEGSTMVRIGTAIFGPRTAE